VKRKIFLLISICILSFSVSLAAEVPERNRLLSHIIDKTFWYAKGGKIELTSGTWRFGVTERTGKTRDGEIVDSDFTFFCVFTVVNNSTSDYKINPSLLLLDGRRETRYRIPPVEYFTRDEHYRRRYDQTRLFKPVVLAPGEKHMFEDSFGISQATVVNVCELKLKLILEEIE